jgi:hypothetical protein
MFRAVNATADRGAGETLFGPRAFEQVLVDLWGMLGENLITEELAAFDDTAAAAAQVQRPN